MNQLTAAGLLCILPLSAIAEPTKPESEPDMIRFSNNANNDTLHGKFLAFKSNDTLTFENPEAQDPITFSTQKLHRITLGRGRERQTLSPTSTVTLINGDIIPGKIVQADAKTVVLDTEHMNQVTLPADTVSVISPTPHGGKLIYYGPLGQDGWKAISPPKDEKETQKEPKNTKKKNEKLTDWRLVAGAWYAGTEKDRYLVRENALTDKCKVKFKLGWRGSLYCNVGIHADLSPPKYETKEKVSNNMASTLGSSYVLSISSHSASLYQCTFDEDGKPQSVRTGQSHISLGLSRAEEAEFELRLDRPNKVLMLYVNDDFKCKWDLGEKYVGKGTALAFKKLPYGNSELRVSEILISQWNGMRDSAQSMQTSERDVILLTNGVDRFSGTFKHIRNGNISFRGSFHNDLTIPLSSVQEIHLAKNKLRKLPEDNEDNAVRFYLQPYGRISGTPNAGENGRTKIHSDIVGNVSLDMKFVNIIDFSHQNSLLDFWDDNF